MQNAVVPTFPVVYTISTGSPKHCSTSIIYDSYYNTDDLATYRGSNIQVHETCHQDIMITITIDAILIPLKGNGTVTSVFV